MQIAAIGSGMELSSQLQQPGGKSFSSPVFRLQNADRDRESHGTFQARGPDSDSSGVMGDRVPTRFKRFRAPQKIVPFEPFGDALFDSHGSEDNTYSSYADGMKFLVEGFLQGMQPAVENEAELRGSNYPVHFQVVKA